MANHQRENTWCYGNTGLCFDLLPRLLPACLPACLPVGYQEHFVPVRACHFHLGVYRVRKSSFERASLRGCPRDYFGLFLEYLFTHFGLLDSRSFGFRSVASKRKSIEIVDILWFQVRFKSGLGLEKRKFRRVSQVDEMSTEIVDILWLV